MRAVVSLFNGKSKICFWRRNWRLWTFLNFLFLFCLSRITCSADTPGINTSPTLLTSPHRGHRRHWQQRSHRRIKGSADIDSNADIDASKATQPSPQRRHRSIKGNAAIAALTATQPSPHRSIEGNTDIAALKADKFFKKWGFGGVAPNSCF